MNWELACPDPPNAIPNGLVLLLPREQELGITFTYFRRAAVGGVELHVVCTGWEGGVSQEDMWRFVSVPHTVL